MRNTICIFLFIILSCMPAVSQKIRVVTTTQDMASITELIGGDRVEVTSLSSGWQDPHLVEPRPSMVMKLKKADLMVKVGMDLDMWIDGMIDAARNSAIYYGNKGYIDASVGIKVLEKPVGKIDGSMGDIHLYGNPHYWLSPENGKVIACNIRDGLIGMSPENRGYFMENYTEFVSALDKKVAGWKAKMEELTNKKIVTYHTSWSYLADYFGLEVIATIEPKPGIPPRPAYLNSLIETIKSEKPGMIMQAEFYSDKNAKMLSRETGVPYKILPTSVGAVKGVDDYIGLFEYIIDKISS